MTLAVVVVAYVAWALREDLHRGEGSPVALAGDAAAHFVVGVAGIANLSDSAAVGGIFAQWSDEDF